MVVDALAPLGFDFEESVAGDINHPLIRGFSTLGPYFTIWSVGGTPGVIEFSLSTHWSPESEPPMAAILKVVDLVTPNWEGASEWVREQIEALAGQDEGEHEEIEYGNYAIRVSAHKVVENSAIQVSVSPRFASCADALAAQDWTTKGSVGDERGYASWRVPLEPDTDGDKVVCENIPQ